MRRERTGSRVGRERHHLALGFGLLSVVLLMAGLLALAQARQAGQGPDDVVARGKAHDAPAVVRAAAGPAVRPEHLDIPGIDVHTSLMPLGLQDNGEIEVPPLSRAGTAGWYRHSPTPGDKGPAVIVGHVDSDTGPAVFYRLGSLGVGDPIRVRRTDRTVAEFRVTRVRTYAKSRFPTKQVYGPVRHAGLRLITCSGQYVAGAGGYQSNTVVYATLHRLTTQPERPDLKARTDR